MNRDPQKFFSGLMDFFSILLPGALLTYLLMGEVGPVVLGERYAKLAGAQAWAVFLFASYLFGHLVFLLGSWLDEFYDWARRYMLNTQISILARRGRVLVTTTTREAYTAATKKLRPKGGGRAGLIIGAAIAAYILFDTGDAYTAAQSVNPAAKSTDLLTSVNITVIAAASAVAKDTLMLTPPPALQQC